MPEGQSVTQSLRASCACRELGTTAAPATPPGMPSLYPVGQLSAQQMEGVALRASYYDGAGVVQPGPLDPAQNLGDLMYAICRHLNV